MVKDNFLAPKLLEPFRVEVPGGIRVPRVRSRAGRCYELAGKFVLEHRNATLVHGVVRYEINHAWAEIDGLVYDGTCGGLFHMEDYYRVMDAVPDVKMNHQQAMEELAKSSVWGPSRRGLFH